MGGKLGIVENTNVEASQLFAGDYKTLKLVTIAKSGVLARGAVLQRAVSGEYEAINPGVGKACGVLASVESTDATDAAVAGVPVVIQGPVRAVDLVWPAAATAEQIAAHTLELDDYGVPVI